MEIIFNSEKTFIKRRVDALLIPSVTYLILISFFIVYSNFNLNKLYYFFVPIIIISFFYFINMYKIYLQTIFWIEKVAICDEKNIFLKVKKRDEIFINQEFCLDGCKFIMTGIEGKGSFYKLIFSSGKVEIIQHEISDWNAKKMRFIIEKVGEKIEAVKEL